jgi:hypothetical protein
MEWLAECSFTAVRAAVGGRAAAGRCPVAVAVPDPAATADQLWWSSSAAVGDRFIEKFAWSRPAALRLANEIGVLTALARDPKTRPPNTAHRPETVGAAA